MICSDSIVVQNLHWLYDCPWGLDKGGFVLPELKFIV